MDGVLEFVGQNLIVGTSTGKDALSVNVNYLTLIAFRADTDRVLVDGTVITGYVAERGVLDV